MTETNTAVAIDAVRQAMYRRGWNLRDLATAAQLDPGTVGDFLDGKRWPRMATLGKIESALSMAAGTLQAVAEGRPPPSPVGPADDDAGFVADRGPDDRPPGISDDELLAMIRHQREAIDAHFNELERRLRERSVDGP